MRCVIAMVSLGGLVVAAGLAAIWLGLPEVAATTPHWAVTEWVLTTTRDNAVRRRASVIPVPDDLDDPGRIRAGASAYDAMCADCHGAPGVDAGVAAEGMLPRPPELAAEAVEWESAELFWIVENGIRMTGMPAFGPTHTDRELWDLVAALRRLPGLSASEYRALVRSEDDGHRPGHHHGHGAGDARSAPSAS